MEKRLTWLAVLVLLWGGIIGYNLISLQIIHHGVYARKARAQQERLIDIPAPRGAILDRNGRQLALSVRGDSVCVDPLKLPDLKFDSELLAQTLHADAAEFYGRIKQAYDGHRGFMRVQRRLTPEQTSNLRSLPVEWIDLRNESQRHYPNGMLAAHVLGGVDFEENGNAGIEKALNAKLSG